jgi:tetratricopeptide (TPR) repeat protein
MKVVSRFVLAALGVALAAPIVSAAGPAEAEASQLGRLEFPVTGTHPDCQRLFDRGMLEKHSFQYDQAHATFQAALKADPGCAMAAWGDAMAYSHPIWSERDVPKAQAALARITNESALTAKERAYIATARALFGAPDLRAGTRTWLAATAKMRADHPEDDEVALQHALALIAVYGYDKNAQKEQSQAGAIALDVLSRRPDHPGAAHYVIHAFDNPEHAILALPAARTYARIAPAAGHALHMPSHTFTHLGMWRDVVPSNDRAYSASQGAAKALGQGRDKWDWHSYSWLTAAHLELGQAEKARKLMEDARALLAADDSADLRIGYAEVLRNYISQTGRWSEAESLAAPLLAPLRGEGKDGNGPVACAEHAPGGSGDERPPLALIGRANAHILRGEAALRANDPATAEARAKDVRTVVDQMKPWASAGRPVRSGAALTAHADEIVARAALLRARTPETEKAALDALEKAAQTSEAFVAGPAFFPTGRERLAEALMAMGRAKEALGHYEQVVAARPNRALSLLGAARAAHAAGETEKASAHYATLSELWKDADRDLPALAEVLAGARAERMARSAR